MPLKDNQPILKELVVTIFKAAKLLSTHKSVEKGHGRIEKRECSVIDTKLLQQEGMYVEWPGLKRIIRVRRERTEEEVTTDETVYYLSSEEKDDAEYYNDIVRKHWGIENKLHWMLDVVYGEDDCRISGNGAVNLSAMRKYALELTKGIDDKRSVKRRRKACMYDLDILESIFLKKN